ncbi:hypothetical protein PTW35_25965 (plasmid) [Photobacterium sp. DA100]|uniref:hypothetical protein n=1 Tax=Photobacterium sp. DA100 TaxID=3027472 RepID=UPI00247A12DD|nr:hypothetical protein [Photobacterium sp. DA100]WEM44703.1 hypothetical protein PTW35_25965 [Photobacterium sp. DA100]
MLELNVYHKFIVTLEPVINVSRVISGYEVGLKPKNDLLVRDVQLDYNDKLNLIIYMLDRLTYFVESKTTGKSFSDIVFYITLRSEYLQEPRVLVFVNVLKNLLESKGSSLVFIFNDNDFSNNVNLLYSYDFYYPTCTSIQLGVMCFDLGTFNHLDSIKNNNISVLKFSFDLRRVQEVITQVIPVCNHTNTMLLFENINDEGLFFEASGIGNAIYKGGIAGSIIYLI